jgi:hypothetical protein
VGRLDREPRPSREELEATLKLLAETDNMDGDAYLLAAEVRALREELGATTSRAEESENLVRELMEECRRYRATLGDGFPVQNERKHIIMPLGIVRNSRLATLEQIDALVKAARAVADAEASSPDKPVHLLAELQIALKPFDTER